MISNSDAVTCEAQVWMSHGDEAVRLPDGFQSVATSEQVLLRDARPPEQTLLTPS